MTNLDPRAVLDSPGGITSPISLSAIDSSRFTMSLTMSRENLERLERIARAGGSSIGDVIAKAFILYDAAAEASRQGKAVGIAPTPDVLETEFIGF